MELSFDSTSARMLALRADEREIARVPAPVHVLVSAGADETPVAEAVGGYVDVTAATGVLVGRATLTVADAEVAVTDVWAVVDSQTVRLTRQLGVIGVPGAECAVQLRLAVQAVAGEQRFFTPGMAYAPGQWAEGGRYTFADHHLAYPVVASRAENGVTLSLARVSLARYDDLPRRSAGQSAFPHRTDIGSVGFEAGSPATLHAAWPYAEFDTSTMLDARRTPAVALHPVPDDGLDVTLTYEVRVTTTDGYADAVRDTFERAMLLAGPTPSVTPVPLRESIDLRLDSAGRTYAEFDNGFAGFVLNFDPDRGYASQAKAFGASFADHGMDGSREIFEYGFTGRQLNLAHELARRSPSHWAERSARVVDAFVERMTTPSGWVHTVWDQGRERPRFACGDPDGTVMHYLGRSDVPGTYTRMMSEAGSDLLRNVRLRPVDDSRAQRWFGVVERLAEFFLAVQEPDGAWYRAYAPDGTALTGEWFGARGSTGKSATGTVIPFLLDVAEHIQDGERYVTAASRAARFILDAHVASDEFRGGTLDNPNVVDKEAAFIAMRALLGVYRHRPEPALLDGARRAAVQAVTWHNIWEVPATPGTRLHRERVRSIGWGGINPVWGVGVTDIYSLFFLADLHELGCLVDDPLLTRVAELVAHSSLQILAVPGDLHGFTDVGMQPEGISFCPQGLDDGLIAKGDTWGGLGWPYTAGTFALGRYLDARERLKPAQ